MALRIWRIGLTEVVCDGCGRVERREDRPSGYNVLLQSGWQERPHRGLAIGDGLPLELLCPACAQPREAV
jgi:hypothetical protein